jgi:hypothetical protein
MAWTYKYQNYTAQECVHVHRTIIVFHPTRCHQYLSPEIGFLVHDSTLGMSQLGASNVINQRKKIPCIDCHLELQYTGS